MNDIFTGATLKATTMGLVSPRQAEATLWVGEGKDTEETATILGCAMRTAKSHVEAAMLKLGARNRAHLVAKAFAKGVLSPLIICLCANVLMPSNDVNLYRHRTRRLRSTTAQTAAGFVTPSQASAT